MNSIQKGHWAEDVAARFLEESGYLIRHRNFRTRFGELDIVALDGTALAFVEVRSRDESQGRLFVAPQESILYNRKRTKLTRAARFYLSKYPTSLPCRFDVLGITLRGASIIPHFHLIKDAFRVGQR